MKSVLDSHKQKRTLNSISNPDPSDLEATNSAISTLRVGAKTFTGLNVCDGFFESTHLFGVVYEETFINVS